MSSGSFIRLDVASGEVPLVGVMRCGMKKVERDAQVEPGEVMGTPVEKIM